MATYDPRSALIVVDMQNDFAHPWGSLFVAGGDQIVGPIDDEARTALQGGAFIAYTQDWHPPVTPHFQKDGGVWPVHCVQDTWGAEFAEGIEALGPVIQKGSDGRDGYSGFSVRDPQSGERSDTRLEALLREHHISRLVICGLATDYCVVETALDATRLGFDTIVLTDLIAAVNLHPGDGERALERMAAAGVTLL